MTVPTKSEILAKLREVMRDSSRSDEVRRRAREHLNSLHPKANQAEDAMADLSDPTKPDAEQIADINAVASFFQQAKEDRTKAGA